MRLMLDQPGRARRDVARQGVETGRHRIARLDRLADVVQQGGELEFLVIVKLAVGQLEDLQAVIERVPLGMVDGDFA